MGKKQKAGMLLSAMLLAFAALSGCGTSQQSGILKVGVRDDIVGLGYLNPTAEKYYGLEIDIAERLAKELGYQKAEFVTVQPDNRKDMLLNGEVDCLIAAYSISDTRLKNFDFSAPYYKDQIKIMIQQSSLIKEIEDLKGKKIGILSGVNTAVEFAVKMNELGLVDDFDAATFDADTYKGGVSFESFESYSDLSTALEEGRVDAVCMDGSIAKAYMDEGRICLDTTLSEQDYGVATQKNSKLSKKVETSIQKMLDNGTVDELIDKWD